MNKPIIEMNLRVYTHHFARYLHSRYLTIVFKAYNLNIGTYIRTIYTRNTIRNMYLHATECKLDYH